MDGMQFSFAFSERIDSDIKCNDLSLSWQTVLKNSRLEKVRLDLRMTWIDPKLPLGTIAVPPSMPPTADVARGAGGVGS